MQPRHPALLKQSYNLVIPSNLENDYKPKIEYYVQKSKDYRAKAQELGISFGFTEEFIIKQQQSIEIQFLNENQ